MRKVGGGWVSDWTRRSLILKLAPVANELPCPSSIRFIAIQNLLECVGIVEKVIVDCECDCGTIWVHDSSQDLFSVQTIFPIHFSFHFWGVCLLHLHT